MGRKGIETFNRALGHITAYGLKRNYIEFRDQIIQRQEITDDEQHELSLLAAHCDCSNEARDLIQTLIYHAADCRNGIAQPFQFEVREVLPG